MRKQKLLWISITGMALFLAGAAKAETKMTCVRDGKITYVDNKASCERLGGKWKAMLVKEEKKQESQEETTQETTQEQSSGSSNSNSNSNSGGGGGW